MSEDWTLIYSTTILHQAELLKHVLSDHQILAVVVDKSDSFYKFGNIELYVKPSEVIKAKHIISKTEF